MMKPKGKRSISDKISRRAHSNNEPGVRRNPFELFLTKAKHIIAGRPTGNAAAAPAIQKLQQNRQKNQNKHGIQIEAQGIRSVSRNTAFQNRQKTLLDEYRTRTKKNKLIDRRLGEKDANMTLEDKMMERMIFERKHAVKSKRNLFNLNEEQELAEEDGGFGQTLADIERMEEEQDEDPPEEVADDILGEKFVAEHHFGGGLLKKKISSDDPDGEDESRSKFLKVERKQLVDDIIAESKQKKYDRQTELDEVRDMTKSLDDKWKDVQMRNKISSAFSTAVHEPPVESYDSLVKMLQFEGKAKGSDKLKSDAELAKEAKEELEKAEKKRLKSAQKTIESPFKEKISAEAHSSQRGARVGLEMLEPEFENVDYSEDGSISEESADEDKIVVKPGDAAIDGTDIPFVIKIPKNRRAMEALLKDRSPEESLTIATRIMKYHHMSLSEDNREKLTKFFKLLLDYLLTKTDTEPKSALKFWNCLTFPIAELFQISAEKGKEFVRLRLEALSKLVCRKKYTVVPSALLFLKFVTVCYPLEKHYSPEISVLNLLLGKALTKSAFVDLKSLLVGLFIATMATESVEKSRRYFPELVGYLGRLLAEFVTGFQSPVGFDGTVSKFSLDEILSVETGVKLTSLHRLRALYVAVGLLERLVPVYEDLPAYSEIFKNFVDVLEKIQKFKGIPADVNARCGSFKQLVASHRKERPYLTFFKKKPAPLKLLEPRIDSKFDTSKSAKKATIKRLLHDKKRAVKGAKRELRRDNQFIARVQLDEQLKKDVTRRKKVKEIFSGLYSQQTEHKAMQRQKAKFKM